MGLIQSNRSAASSRFPLRSLGIAPGQSFEAGFPFLKSLMQFLIYLIMFGVLAYVFQNQIEQLTGINPVNATISLLEDIGMPVKSMRKSLE